ncbi:MAG: flagellar biosynthetic protein FliQ [Planctomycetota bacterium]
MSVGTAMDLTNEALMLTLILAAPIMIIGMLVGLLISIMQAVTQLHEQTLTFVPKIVAMGLATVVFIPWLTTRLIEYTVKLWGNGALM